MKIRPTTRFRIVHSTLYLRIDCVKASSSQFIGASALNSTSESQVTDTPKESTKLSSSKF